MPKKKKKSAKTPQKKRRNPLLFIVSGILLTFLIGFGVYSVVTYQNSSQEAEGFLTCNANKTKCELSQHIHADIKMTVCGEEITFPKEKGNINLQHTHKENNKLHWHARIKVDPQTQEPLDTTPMQLKAFLEQMDYTLPASCPNNANPVLSVEINATPTEKLLEYVWSDGDIITVEYN